MSEERPEWLPDVVSVDGEWNSVLLQLYQIFVIDFKVHPLTLQTMPVFIDNRILEEDGYEEAFWHLITRFDTASNERLLDRMRAERLPWAAPAIKHSESSEVLWWFHHERKDKTNIYLWLVNYDYVIIFEKRGFRIGDVAWLITAYHLDGNDSRRRLRSKYENRIR